MADVELGGASAAAAAANDAAPFVSGSISLPSAEENTLDEPVSATIVRASLCGGYDGCKRFHVQMVDLFVIVDSFVTCDSWQGN